MFRNIDQLTELAEEARHDFEAGVVSNDHLLEVCGLYLPRQMNAIRFSIDHGISLTFPLRACELASAVLRHRTGHGQIVSGGYLYDGGYLDAIGRYKKGPNDLGYKPHAVLEVGITAVSQETIVDITADQYGGPKVYVGPLVDPWARQATM